MNIDIKDIENMLRHAFLMGTNAGLSLAKDPNYDFSDDQEECVKELLELQQEEGFTCYGNICGNEKHEDQIDCLEEVDNLIQVDFGKKKQ